MMKEIIYDKELEFLKKLIKQLNIPLSTPTLKHSVLSEVYLGLRHALGLEEQIVVDIDSFFDRSLQPNTILYVTDEFFTNMVISRA